MKEFDVEFGKTEFKDDDARQLASYVHDVEILQLKECKLTSLGIEALSLAIRQNKQV